MRRSPEKKTTGRDWSLSRPRYFDNLSELGVRSVAAFINRPARQVNNGKALQPPIRWWCACPTSVTDTNAVGAAQQRRYSFQDFHDDTAGIFSLGVLTPPELAALIDRHHGIAAMLVDWLARIEEA